MKPRKSASTGAEHLLLCGPGVWQACVRFETVRPAGRRLVIFGERNARGMRPDHEMPKFGSLSAVLTPQSQAAIFQSPGFFARR
jgi:hypothetical protein